MKDNNKKMPKTGMELIDELFAEGDPRRGDAMVVAGISRIEGRAEMRELILRDYDKRIKDSK